VIAAAGGVAILLTAGLHATAAEAAKGAKTYKNCTALNKVYPHGVGKPGAHDHTTSSYKVTNFKRSKTLYRANKSMDRDGDKIACEKR